MCVKVLERLIYNRVNPLILESLPNYQADFRPLRSCEDQVIPLTTHYEAEFEKGLKNGAVFVDLAAAFDTVWRESIIYKLLNLLRCRKVIHLVNNMLSDRSIQVVMGTKLSKVWKLSKGLSRIGHSVNTTLNVSLGGTVLPHNSNPKYLGIILDSTASFNEHLTNVAAKLRIS